MGSCGNIPTNLRKDLYRKLVKLKVNSNFQKIASNGSAYNFIKPVPVNPEIDSNKEFKNVT